MNISKQGIELIKQFEGCRLTAYKCPAGVLTIGYGHTGKDVHYQDVITKEQAEKLLKKDLMFFEMFVSRCVKVPLNQNQFDALVSFAYNIGITAFKNSTLLKLLNQFEYDKAADQFKRWKYANGKILLGLARRRQAEEDLFKYPESNQLSFS